MKFQRVLLRIGLLVVPFCAAAWGQDTGSITGTVKDPSGASIAGAAVVPLPSDRYATVIGVAALFSVA